MASLTAIVYEKTLVNVRISFSATDENESSCREEPFDLMHNRVTSEHSVTLIGRLTFPALHDRRVIDIKSRCLSAYYVTASRNYWTGRRLQSFFSITAYTINHGHFEPYVLDFSPISEAHTAEALLSRFTNVARTYDMEYTIF